ncbi:MAG: DivIVA domain-containing protein [Deltaproteobacteria bacterium]|nr:DivIVA domain-containing protein [Deltaproteobacteria bacterium]
MKITALEIRSHQIKKSLRGYDVRETASILEMAADAIEEATREINRLEDRLRETTERLAEHMANENILKETITSAQRMVEDLKNNAKKEAELIVAEARLQGDEIVRQAHARATQVQEEIHRLKKHRIELETKIRALIDYHSTTLLMEEDDARKADEESEKLKFFSKP